MKDSDIEQIKSLVGEANVKLPPQARRYSNDYYWFSPLLAISMKDLEAELVVHVRDLESLKALVAYCLERAIPITPRGAGTGNYGQAVPLQGGVLLDFQTMDELLEIDSARGQARCSAGVRCQRIEEAAREVGWEMMMYPSTWVRATIGGFLAGGSAGIGSIRNGLISDGRMVQSLKILSAAEKGPTLCELEGEECADYLHSYGVNGLIVEAVINLMPKLPWDQVTFSAKELESVFSFAVELGGSERFDLRLLNIQQWPIPSFFKPIRSELEDGEHIVQIEVVSTQLPALRAMAKLHGLTERIHYPHHEPRRSPMLSDFVQNHSTLWAKKYDNHYTYLAVKLGLTNWQRDLAVLADAPGNPMYLRCDFNCSKNVLAAAAGPIFYAGSPEEVTEKADYLKAHGLYFYDVHSSYIDRDGMKEKSVAKLRMKSQVDPKGILNAGRILGDQGKDVPQ